MTMNVIAIICFVIITLCFIVVYHWGKNVGRREIAEDIYNTFRKFTDDILEEKNKEKDDI